MANYLVVAHQTAGSLELIEALRRKQQEDPEAAFVLLVPITFSDALVVPQSGDELRVVARARRVGASAAEALANEGINLVRVEVGDELPVVAIEEELADHPSKYAGIIICTLHEQLSRWLRLDQLRQIENQFGLPVTHVIGTPELTLDGEALYIS